VIVENCMSSDPTPTAAADAAGAEARRRLRDVLGHYATGVTVVSAVDPDGNDVGLTVNSFTSVSLDPPLILWCLGRESALIDTFAAGRPFAVNVLAAEQLDVALRFADKSPDKFAGLPVERGIGDTPLLGGCVARLQCTTRDVLPGGDHLILLAEVVRTEHSAGRALLFHRGRFSRTDDGDD
jgi:flavin reductase (DIM6/NTAB) family NADH-FMN oxidoreductase RutF